MIMIHGSLSVGRQWRLSRVYGCMAQRNSMDNIGIKSVVSNCTTVTATDGCADNFLLEHMVKIVEWRWSDRALMGYVLLPKRMRGRLLDVNVCRWEGGGMSDQFLVEARLHEIVGWVVESHEEWMVWEMCWRWVNRIRVWNNGHTRRACLENRKCWEVWMSRVWRRNGKSGETKWRSTNDVCGVRRVGKQRRE